MSTSYIVSTSAAVVASGVVYFQLSSKIEELKERIKKLEENGGGNYRQQAIFQGNQGNINEAVNMLMKKVSLLEREGIELKKENNELKKNLDETINIISSDENKDNKKEKRETNSATSLGSSSSTSSRA